MEEKAVDNQVEQTSIKPSVPKHSHWIIVLIALIFIGIIYVFSNQPQNQIPIPPPEPPLPSITDETESWKTYTNTKYGFEFKHPSWGEHTGTFGSYFPGGSDLVLILVSGQILGNHEGVSVHSNIEILPKLPNMSLKERLEIKYNIKDGQKGNIDTAYQQNQELSDYYWTVLKPSQKPGTAIEYPKGKIVYNEYSLNGIPIFELGDPSLFTYMTFFLPQNKNYIYVLTLELSGAGNVSVEPPDSYFIETYKQMVKTFKFTPASPTGGDPEDQVVCTQDAKLCTDGVTYVGREGPNCEFAPCPGN